MASQLKEPTYGSVEIYIDDILGIGSYGKVCRAKCGQLPCAAKLLHDTLFQDNDPGTHNLTMKFLQECRFLISIKHPNIVQCLGTIRDPESRRPVLLMELMDESLTKFLERSTTFVPYHIQVNICYDVALAVAYLHSNGIIHRDLSSNNVLLIGSGSRAKVTDFGMSKFVDMNPRMTPLTQCPGTSAYMPPEALTIPPQYSNKMDCFSLGVLAIQMETRNFPDPGDATTIIEDARFPTGHAFVFIPEADRRKKDIDMFAPDHPLLPIIFQCIRDKEGERPSADELCERLASLKRESRYTHGVAKIGNKLQKEKGKSDQIPGGQMKLSWRKGKQTPTTLISVKGAAVVHGNTAFFSHDFNVYSYIILEDEWTKLQCEYQETSLAIVHDTLTTVGGCTSDRTPTNTLLSLSQSGSGWKWGKGLPSMMTKRILPATVTITTHLVVAAGKTK